MIVPIRSTVASSALHNVLFNVLVKARTPQYILTVDIIHAHILYSRSHDTLLLGRCLILQQAHFVLHAVSSTVLLQDLVDYYY